MKSHDCFVIENMVVYQYQGRSQRGGGGEFVLGQTKLGRIFGRIGQKTVKIGNIGTKTGKIV